MAVLARADGVLGEVVLRDFDADGPGGGAPEARELLVNGVLLMDTEDASTERPLAAEALDQLPRRPLHLLVGGLGLGFTAAQALADPRTEALHVVEIEPVLLDWARQGLLPSVAPVLADPRTTVTVDDVAAVVRGLPGESLDAVLLDVDNGPDFLVSPRNAALYGEGFLAAALRRLRPGGVLSVWSADRSDALAGALDAALAAVGGGRSTHVEVVVRRGARDLDYHLHSATRPHGRM